VLVDALDEIEELDERERDLDEREDEIDERETRLEAREPTAADAAS
jgi:hypothetical protein